MHPLKPLYVHGRDGRLVCLCRIREVLQQSVLCELSCSTSDGLNESSVCIVSHLFHANIKQGMIQSIRIDSLNSLSVRVLYIFSGTEQTHVLYRWSYCVVFIIVFLQVLVEKGGGIRWLFFGAEWLRVCIATRAGESILATIGMVLKSISIAWLRIPVCSVKGASCAILVGVCMRMARKIATVRARVFAQRGIAWMSSLYARASF